MKDKLWALYKLNRYKDEIFSQTAYAEGKKDGLDIAYDVVEQITDVRGELEIELPDFVKAYIHAEKNKGRTLYQAIEIAPINVYKYIDKEDSSESFAKYWIELGNEVKVVN